MPGSNDFSLDPMFVGAADHDYRLEEESPCIDAGDPNPVFNDPDGSRCDVGAVPFEPVIYICGDADGNGVVNILDITRLINYLYKDGEPPDPPEAGDANGNGIVNILDITHLINFLYKDGPPPLCPEKEIQTAALRDS
jgi:hypothetical protein